MGWVYGVESSYAIGLMLLSDVALAAGQALDEHENPGEATVHVLHGRVRLVAGDDRAEAGPGDLVVVPDARHRLEALADSAVLLTVAKH
jgi:quercetin dioxygenase-like cupin family protein